MKKILALLLLTSATPLLAQQQIRTDQLKLKANGGLQGSSNSTYVGPYRGTSAPASPATGQLWVDTTTTPPILKSYNGSSWDSLANNLTVPTQANSETFPSTPSDGQIFYSKRDRRLFIYDSTGSTWRDAWTGNPTAASVVLSFTGTTIADPTSAPTLAASGTGGSWSAGTHYCVYTWRSATGGETLASPSASVVTAAGQKIDVTLANGGGATAGKNIYCTASSNTTDFVWMGAIGDNTTTTVSLVGQADAGTNFGTYWKQNRPVGVNWSAPLPSGWTCLNVRGVAYGGGCGSTGASIIIKSTDLGAQYVGSTNDPYLVSATYDMSGYSASWWKVKLRVKRIGYAFPIPGSVVNVLTYRPQPFHIRAAATAGERFLSWGYGGDWTSTSQSYPLQTQYLHYRTSASGASAETDNYPIPWPPMTNAITDGGIAATIIKKANANNFQVFLASPGFRQTQPMTSYATFDESTHARSTQLYSAALAHVGIANYCSDNATRALVIELDYADIETW